jgi:hypothetical protein
MKASRPMRDFYVGLGAEQRARLWRAAIERGDDEDAELILTTCPRQTGTLRDVRFAELAAAAAPARLAEILDFVERSPQPFVIQIRHLEHTREEKDLIDAFRAGKTKPPPQEPRPVARLERNTAHELE